MLQRLSAALLAIILLVPAGMNASFGEDKDYSLTDAPFSSLAIDRAFVVMDSYVSQDDRLYLVIDRDAALADRSITALDVEILSVFKQHNDEIMDAYFAGGLSPENEDLAFALEAFSSGKLRNLFEDNSIMGNSANRPAISESSSVILGSVQVLESAIQPVGFFSPTACGPYNFKNMHPESDEEGHGPHDKSYIEYLLLSQGYHVIYVGSGYPGWDYGKFSGGFGGCDNGEFRDQALIKESSKNANDEYIYNTQANEPNPELYAYIHPTYWWGSYVAYWHYKN